jgi:triosephosphate isomerase
MLIVGNWKAYVEDAARAKKLASVAKKLAQGAHQIVVAPSAPYLGLLAQSNRSKLAFAAQDVSATTGGAHTGEMTAQALAGAGIEYAIIGHSERRAMGETDMLIAEKVQHALAHAITPIICVGESIRDEGAEYLSVVRKQVSAAFQPLSSKERLSVVVAYEPVWAIGKTAADAITSSDLAEMVLYVRKVISDFMPGKAPQRVKVLYGGSVEATNARELASGSGIDGFLIGHASADPVSFSAIVKAVS